MFHGLRCFTALYVPQKSIFHDNYSNVPQNSMLHNSRCSTEFNFSPFGGGRSVAAARAAATQWHEDNYWEMLCIRLAQCRKFPYCVGVILRVEVAHAVLCFWSQA